MPALLTRLQRGLEQLYRIATGLDVGDFVIDAELRAAALDDAVHPRTPREQLLLAEDGGGLSVALFVDPGVVAHLERHDPAAALGDHNVGDFLLAVEGVSHFVYVAWNTGHDKPVTLLELELQAEVDKYVLGAWLLRQQGEGRFPRELHRALFERARVDPVAAAGRISLYHTASSYAARFCRRVAAALERKRFGVTRDLMAELRRFYRWGNTRKLRHIERYA